MALNPRQGHTEAETHTSGRSFCPLKVSTEICCQLGTFIPRLSSLLPTSLPTFPVIHLKESTLKKNLNSFSSSFCFLIVLHQKYVFVLSFLFFFIQTSFWEDPRSEFFFSYMCWASIMSKYLASMIWGRTLFLSTEKESERHQIRLFPPFFTGNVVNQHICTPTSLALAGGRGQTMAGIVGNKPPDA